jgi:hypothetical protein
MPDLSSSAQHIPTALAKFLFPLLESTNFRFWPNPAGQANIAG